MLSGCWFNLQLRGQEPCYTLQKQDAFHDLKILDTYSLIAAMMVVVRMVVRILLIAVPMMLIRFFF